MITLSLPLEEYEVRARQRIGEEYAELRFTTRRAKPDLFKQVRNHSLLLWAREHHYPTVAVQHNGWTWEVSGTIRSWFLACLVLPEPAQAYIIGYNQSPHATVCGF